MLSIVDATGLPEVDEWLKGGLEGNQSKLHRVAKVARPTDVVREVARHKPDLVLLSTGLGDTRALQELLPQIREANPPSRLILLHGRTGRNTAELVTEAVRNGYYDFTGPFATATDIIELIEHPRMYSQAVENPLVLQELLQPEEEPMVEEPEPVAPQGNMDMSQAAVEQVAAAAGAGLYERLQGDGVRLRSARQPQWTTEAQAPSAPSQDTKKSWLWPVLVILVVSLAANAYLYTFYPKYEALSRDQQARVTEQQVVQQGHSIPLVMGKVVTVSLPLAGGTQAPDILSSQSMWTNNNNLAQTLGVSLRDLMEARAVRFSNFLGYPVTAPPSWANDYVATIFPQLAGKQKLTAVATAMSGTVLTHGPNWALVAVKVTANINQGGQVVKRGSTFGLAIGLMRGPNGWGIVMLRLMPGAMLQGLTQLSGQ